MSDRLPDNKAKVYLVGAGPGDPGLITMRGVACLQRADVVLYDYLVNPVIAQHAPAAAELICLGRHGGHSRIWTQDEINQKLLELVRSGKTVARLKGGDPAVFARGGEEAAFLLAHGVAIEIVPGITAALAAGSHAGIPITHREHASAVAFVTGHEDPSKPEAGVDFAALARFPGTLIFYMGVTTVRDWSTKLMQHGLAPTTPAAIVQRCSLPNQKVVRCELGDVADHLTPYSKMPPPVVVIVGQVAAPEIALDWLSSRPLFGQSVLVTRPVAQAAGLGELLAEQGAEVLYQPAIEIRAPQDGGEIDRVLERLSTFDWLVFSSRNGVEFFMQRLLATGRDVRALRDARLAAIGPATAAALAAYHLVADRQPPSEFRAESLATELAKVGAQRPLLIRASRGRDTLAATLRDHGAQVTEVVAYESIDVLEPDPAMMQRLAADHLAWTTVTSSAIARSLHAMFGEHLRRTRLVSISPVTSRTLRELGYEPTAEASVYTMDGVAAALIAAVREHRAAGGSS